MSLKELSPVYRNKMNFVKENIKSGKRILDVGCGYGEHKKAIKGKAKIYGLDIDKYALTEQKRIVCANAKKIPFKRNNFETVICVDVIEHIDKDNEVIQEIRRVLKKNGKLIITVPNKNFPFTYDPINAFLRIFEKHIAIGMWGWGHLRLYSEKEINFLLNKNGFRIIKIEKRSHAFVGLVFNYFPWIITHIFRPIFKRSQKKSKKENKTILKITEFVNKIDKRYFSPTEGINLCVLAIKK